MEDKLIREVRFLRKYTVVLTTVLVLFIVFSFTRQLEKPRFEEIDVERINVVEKDGQLKMVISNKQRQHPGLADGKEIPPREREAGIIFFTSSGDECGGLVYDGNNQEAGMAFSVDQFKNDQILQLNYGERVKDGKRTRAYGLKLWDRNEEMTLGRRLSLMDSIKALKNAAIYESTMQQLENKGAFGIERFFAGKTNEGEVGLFIRDANGRPRIKLYIDRQNTPRLQFLDVSGKVVAVK